ncbi:MAG: DUF2442 domain-containing protein [Anaerolineae bacterium]|nr:DUF2442 domain-containing protein [Anaerolineae bacterium]
MQTEDAVWEATYTRRHKEFRALADAARAEIAAGMAQPMFYEVQYPISAYTFPQEALIDQVSFDDDYIHVTLTDGRKLSIPLWWIPTLYNAPKEELEKYIINQSRTMIIWDPDKCAINDELRVADYLGPLEA